MSGHTCEATDGYSASWAGEWYSGEYPPRCKHCGRFMPAHGRGDMSGIDRIAYERDRQLLEEGFTRKRDRAEYPDGQLARVAALYALPRAWRALPLEEYDNRTLLEVAWPWTWQWWKPSENDRIRELEKAGALIAAEIDRLLAEARDVD